LNEHGGVIDDLVVFANDARAYRLVVNAGTASQDIEWLQRIANARGPGTDVVPRTDLAILAVQGPLARARLWQAFPELQADTAGLPRFHGTFVRDWFLARTGYTGEDGFEIMLPAPLAARTWVLLARAGVQPCGLGARDTLRLEAGLNLYGHDLDASTSPLESGLAWTVDRSSDRDFLGRAALATPARTRVGLVLLDPGVLRAGQTVCTRHGAGVTTSGSFAPTLGRSIALARVPAAVQPGDTVEVEIRGKRQRARVVTTPFVRDGKTLTDRYLQ
jgi:aminomethyltransferase